MHGDKNAELQLQSLYHERRAGRRTTYGTRQGNATASTYHPHNPNLNLIRK